MAKKLANISVSYDRTTDVLYVSEGDPKPALTSETREGVLVRRDPRTGKPIAVTVLDYENRFRRLRDISWLGSLGLPSDLFEYLRERPAV
jgi:hypothetical protein